MFQPIETIPPLVVKAFLSAEDKDFYTPPRHRLRRRGPRAARQRHGSGSRAATGRSVGASTITQQVAKNFLLSSEQTWDRKIQEAILALRIESTFSKDKILELYLNEIYLGSVGGQTLWRRRGGAQLFRQGALRADAERGGLPRGAAQGRRTTTIRSAIPQAAIERRNWVLDRMLENGYITAEQATVAKDEAAQRRAALDRQPASIRPSISPRKCAASFARSTARTSSMAAGSRCGRRSSRSCRNMRARR